MATFEKHIDRQIAAKHERALEVAQAFHEAYERLAPVFAYETREESAVPWDAVGAKNRALMIATAADLIERGVIACVERGNEPTEWIECLTCSAAVPRGSLDKHELWHEAMQEVRDAVWRSGGLDG